MSDAPAAHGGKSVWRVEEMLQGSAHAQSNEFRPLWDWQEDSEEAALELEAETSEPGSGHPFLPAPELRDEAVKAATAEQDESASEEVSSELSPAFLDEQSQSDELEAIALEDEGLPTVHEPTEAGIAVANESEPIATAEPVVDVEALGRERQAGYDAGYQAGVESLRQEMEEQQQELRALIQSLGESMADQRQFFAPMERLAIHLAEQLLRGELSLSGQAIRRLVENALADLAGHRGKVVVRLNPDDLLKFRRLSDEVIPNVELMADRGLGRGSVRLEMDDGMVEDLVENRLDALAATLLGPGGKVRLPSGGSRRPLVVEGVASAAESELVHPASADSRHVHTLGGEVIPEPAAPSPILIEADALMDEGAAGHGFEA